jgi:hypothetical protein
MSIITCKNQTVPVFTALGVNEFMFIRVILGRPAC